MSADPIIACEDVVEIASRRIIALIEKDYDSIEEAIATAKEIEEQATVARIALELEVIAHRKQSARRMV